MFESRSQIYIERKRNAVNVQRYECKAYLLLWTSEKKVIGKNRDRDRKEDQHNGKKYKETYEHTKLKRQMKRTTTNNFCYNYHLKLWKIWFLIVFI